MRYIFLIVVIFLLSGCSTYNEVEYKDYIPNNSVRIIRTNNDTSILINKDDIYYLLLLNNENIDIEVDYLIKYKDIDTGIMAKEEYLLEETLSLNDITFKLNNKIEILVEDSSLCIYLKELNKDAFNKCNFIYLYNPDKDFYITLDSRVYGLLYHSYTKFNYHFMHHLATVWIDTFTIDKSSYLTIELDGEDFNVTSNKIRNKTIHKK